MHQIYQHHVMQLVPHKSCYLWLIFWLKSLPLIVARLFQNWTMQQTNESLEAPRRWQGISYDQAMCFFSFLHMKWFEEADMVDTGFCLGSRSVGLCSCCLFWYPLSSAVSAKTGNIQSMISSVSYTHLITSFPANGQCINLHTIWLCAVSNPSATV